MTDIDLIPTSYRQTLRLRHYLKIFLIGYGLLLLSTGGAKAVLMTTLNAESQAIGNLNQSKATLLNRKKELERLRGESARLAKRLQMLEKLRGGPPVKDVFLAIDHALNGQVWFLDWQFLRAGEYVPVKPQSVNTGYFIVIPSEKSDGEPRAWQMATHMKIRGLAVDHSVLASFVSRLNREAVIGEVKIISTRVQHASSQGGVDFELAVIVHRPAGMS